MGQGRSDDEAERLEELRTYAILDTPPEPTFDRVVALAAKLCDAPMAVVALVDEGRQWFKASIGIGQRETDRAVAFCSYTIEGSEPFVVSDALADERFADNPLVLAEPHVRAYHGIPLVNSQGFALGTLAVLHHDAQELDELQMEVLEVLADQVMVQLEQHRHRRQLADLSSELRLAAHRLTALVDVWRDLSDSDLTVDAVYEAVPALIMRVLGADGSTLLLRDGDALVTRSYAGYLTEASRVPIAGSIAGRAFTDGRVARSGDHRVDPRAESKVPLPDHSRSFVIAPVEGLEGRIGVIAALDRRVDHFDEADERSIELLAQALGAVVRRAASADSVRRSEERLRMVASATTDAIYDWDLTAGTVWWNEGIESLFGYPAAELEADPALWTELIHPDDRRDTLAGLDAFTRDPHRQTWIGTYRFRRNDQSFAHVSDRAFVSRDAEGRAVRLVGGMADVTAQTEAEHQSHRSQHLEAVGQLTGGVAHDFNNLLTVILGNMDQLSDGLDSRPDLREFADMTRSAALRGADLSHRLLAFARRQPLDPAPVDVNGLLAGLDPLLRRTIPEHVELEIVRGAGAWTAFVDPGQLEGALLNLCLNARDAMPTGGRLTIETTNAVIDRADADRHDHVAPGQYVMVAVSDTGTGIDAELLDRVVEPFFTTKTHGAGSGLGLSMVHGFVKQSGGHIKIDTEVGQGTTVRIYLPRSHESAPRLDEVATVRPDHRGSERILLVEDDELVRRLATRQLKGLGYEVVAAASGAEALEALRRMGHVDLLFTDVVMPGGMSGRELASTATALQPDLRVLYTSGYTENAIVHDGRLDSGVELLSKPYRPAELGRKVRAVLDAARPVELDTEPT
ncbi:hypothetical protein BH23ACT3_BH23ACT3_19400 [soil metagenome]